MKTPAELAALAKQLRREIAATSGPDGRIHSPALAGLYDALSNFDVEITEELSEESPAEYRERLDGEDADRAHVASLRMVSI